MSNCYRVFRNGRLYAIVDSESAAATIIELMKCFGVNASGRVWTYEPAFIEGIGF